MSRPLPRLSNRQRLICRQRGNSRSSLNASENSSSSHQKEAVSRQEKEGPHKRLCGQEVCSFETLTETGWSNKFNKREVNLFNEPDMSAPYQKVQYVECRSASPLNDGGPIQFIIPPTANQLIDLRRTLLHVEATVVRTDGKDLEEGDIWGPINLPLHTFVKQVDVEQIGRAHV